MSPMILDSHSTQSEGSSTPERLEFDSYGEDIPVSQGPEPIAVVGFGLKFPDEASSPDAFWKMMAAQRCASRPYPASRLHTDAFYHPETNKRNTVPLQGGHFIEEDLGAFDANFFSIAPAEAAAMDPAQRILLEVAYHAFENAGIPLERASGSATSVHTGCFTRDHEIQLLRDPETLPKHSATGSSLALLANRLSWFFNLSGPSVNLDSACSSSAMAVDAACGLLTSGDCDMSLVAGTNLTFAIDYTALLSKMSFLSPDSRCHTFDHRANGYARGEGVGAVILKRVSDAIRDGDTIRAVIRSSKSNQDSRTAGITQPSSRAQERIIRETYRKAGLSMKYTRFVEAHGTGTTIGDTTETTALGNAFRRARSLEEPLYVGAVKTSIGHLEGASGIAGLIKAILILESGVILPNTNFEKLNPKIDAEFLKLRFPLSCVPWPTDDLRRISINSFGFGGSNAHIVVDDAYHFLQMHGLRGKHRTTPFPPRQLDSAHRCTTSWLSHTRNRTTNGYSVVERTPQLLVISATDEGGIQRLAERYQEHVSKLLDISIDEDAYLDNLIFTLDSRRSSLPYKAHMPVTYLKDLLDMQQKLSSPTLPRPEVPRPALVFTGQGAQYHDMGRELFAFPVFRNSIKHADKYLTQLHGRHWSATDELFRTADDSRIDRADFSQALCTVLQVALVDLLESVGVSPHATIGHSSGEIAAAYCAGLLSRESAWKIAFLRGRVAYALQSTALTKGCMMAVGLSAQDAEPYVAQVNNNNSKFAVSISCLNSDKSTTISGPDDALDELKALLDGVGVFARKLKVPLAYHSQQMEDVAEEYRIRLGKLSGRAGGAHLPMVSSVTEELVSAADVQNPAYWVRNLISPVRFVGAMKRLCSSTRKSLTRKLDMSHEKSVFVGMLIEVGPHAALQGPIRDIVQSTSRAFEIVYSSILRRGQSSSSTFLNLVGAIHDAGLSVDLRALNDPDDSLRHLRTSLADLPGYSFDHATRYWHESRISEAYRLRKHGYVELLGTPAVDWNPLDAQWRNVINIAELAWAPEHRINGAALCPGAGMMVMAIEGARQLADTAKAVAAFQLRQVSFHNALNLEAENLETRLSMQATPSSGQEDNSWFNFSLYSHKAGSWISHCSGSIQIQYADGSTTDPSGCLAQCLDTWHQRQQVCDFEVDSSKFYQFLNDRGIQYGPCFQAIKRIACGTDQDFTGELALFNEPRKVSSLHVIHPATLDAFMHSIFAAQSRGGTKQICTQVPTAVESLWIANVPLFGGADDCMSISTKLTASSPRSTTCSAFALDQSKPTVHILIEGLEMSAVSSLPASTHEYPGANQVWSHLERSVAIDLLDSHEVTNWLESAVGPVQVSAHGPHKHMQSSRCFYQIGAYLRAFALQNPGMKILEIGAGVGWFTKIALDAMAVQNDSSIQTMLFHRYDVTDVASRNLEECRSALSRYPHKVTFGSFDHEDASSQPEHYDGQYDLVIAADVLRTSGCLSECLSNVRQFLKPGGKLIIFGMTDNKAMKTGFDHSLQPECSQSADAEEDTPLVTPERWSGVLKSSGFSGADIALIDTDRQTQFIVSAADGIPTIAAPLPKAVVVYDPASELQMEVANELEAIFSSEESVTFELTPTHEAFEMQISQDCAHIFLAEIEKPFLPTLDSTSFPRFQHFMRQTSRVLWASGGGGEGDADPGFGMLDGFSRSLRLEMNQLRLVTLTLESHSRSPNALASHIYRVFERTFSSTEPTYEREYVEVSGRLHINRLVPAEHLHADSMGRITGVKRMVQKLDVASPFRVELESPRALDSISFVKDTSGPKMLKDNEIEIEIKAVGLTSTDFEYATGVRAEGELGTECSGVVSRIGPSAGNALRPGDRVCALGTDLLQSHAVVPSSQVVARIPDGVSFDEAAVLPYDLWLAAYMVEDVARVRHGDSILIYADARGVAQACVSIAQKIGALVFIVAKDDEDRRFFEEHLLLPADCILQGSTLASQLRYGKLEGGVDTALYISGDNCVSEMLQCVRCPGHLVHLNTQLPSNTTTPLPNLAPGVSYSMIDAVTLRESFTSPRRHLQSLVNHVLEDNWLPQSCDVFKISDTELALRSLKDMDLRKRAVIRLHPDDAFPVKCEGRSSYQFDPKSSYVVAGGFGGLGRFLTRWMVDKGARNIIILSRSGARSDDAKKLVDELTSIGVRVHAPPCDTSNLAITKAVLDDCAQCMPPIRGCIQSAGTIRDEWFDKMTYDVWADLAQNKVAGSWNLHLALPGELDFLVFTASISGVLGQITQTNYSAGNSYQDALAAYARRHRPGQRAVALDLGLLMTEGLLKDKPDLVQRLLSMGTFLPLEEKEIKAIFDRYCDATLPVQVGAPDLQPVVGIQFPARFTSRGEELPVAMQQPLWSVMRGATELVGGGVDASTDDQTAGSEDPFSTNKIVDTMARAATVAEAGSAAAEALARKVAGLLGTPREAFDAQRPGRAYGLDSLAAVDVRNWISKTFEGVDIPVFDILGDSSAQMLGQTIAKKVAALRTT